MYLFHKEIKNSLVINTLVVDSWTKNNFLMSNNRIEKI